MLSLINNDKGKVTINNNKFSIIYDSLNPHYFLLIFDEFSQSFFIPSCCDSDSERDLNLALLNFSITTNNNKIQLKWEYKSTLWNKEYILDVFEEHAEYFYKLFGKTNISYLHYFEGISFLKFEETHFTKHFNDHKTTPYRDYSKGSTCSFSHLFNPEPNVYSRHLFNYFEYSQISVNSDFSDYCGGNFYFNPGILCFLVKNRKNTKWLSFGLSVKNNEYLFCDYEYIGGINFGLNLNYCGAKTVNGNFETPKIIFCIGDTELITLTKYVSILQNNFESQENKKIYQWWKGPIICPVGQQYYQTDLFRIRSPKERKKDYAGYFACTQLNSENFIKTIDSYGLNWKIFIIDVKWFINPGQKIIDEGRWPNMKQFVKDIHDRGKKVLIWWSPWDTDGWGIDECITYLGDENYIYKNRKGRFSKVDDLSNMIKLAPDISLDTVQHKVRIQLEGLIGSKGVDIDGVKLDHTAATPGLFGMKFPTNSKKIFGIELLHYYQKFLFDTIKNIKEDALIMGQSPNPYFADCTDVIRLGDTYTHNSNSVIGQMDMRFTMAKLANSNWLIDMDGWPMPSLRAFLEYMKYQPNKGIPSLYYSSHLDTTNELIPLEYFNAIKILWDKYHSDI
jgi:hypothetical protein